MRRPRPRGRDLTRLNIAGQAVGAGQVISGTPTDILYVPPRAPLSPQRVPGVVAAGDGGDPGEPGDPVGGSLQAGAIRSAIEPIRLRKGLLLPVV